MSDGLLIYGATGFTGGLIAEEAVRVGLKPVLAGRAAGKLAPLAKNLGLDWLAFDLSDRVALRRAVAGARVVLHAAGPYSRTGEPVVDACLAEGAHYVDICGEIAVLKAVSMRDDEARSRGVMLLAGAGFDVVPTDCLVAHLKTRLPTANAVRLYIGGMAVLSRGSTRTLAESIGQGTIVRRNGSLVELESAPRGFCDFGNGPSPVIGVSLGDVVTAWRSAQIPNINIFFESSPAFEQMLATPRFIRRLLSTKAGQWYLNRQIDKAPIGPSAQQRSTLKTTVVGEAMDAAGNNVRSRIVTPEGYSLTATTSIEIVRRVLEGRFSAGYQTPATMYGADFITNISGVVREDLTEAAMPNPIQNKAGAGEMLTADVPRSASH